MATQTIVTLVDSLNGSTEDVETVTFFHPMTGQKMTIELDAKNRKAMGTHLERMNKYFDAAEPVVEATPVKAVKNDENAKIRAWAKENGFQIGDRGRISEEIRTAYAAAHEVVVTEPTTADVEQVDEATSEPTQENAEPVSEDDVLTILKDMESNGTELTEDNVKAALAESSN